MMVEGVRGGDTLLAEEEFIATFDEFFPLAQRVALRIVGDPHLAEDLALEAFVRLYVRWNRLRTEPRRAGWVLQVATNLAIDTVRRRPARPEPSLTLDPEEGMVLHLALAAALNALPARQRTVVTLRYLADLSEVDVAAALGISRGSVKTHAHRGLGRLRRLLPDYEVNLALDQH